MKTRKSQNRFVRGVKKFLLSAFVVLSFGAYALVHGVRPGDMAAAPAVAQVTGTGSPARSLIVTPTPAPITAEGTPASTIVASPTAAPSSAPAPTSAAPTTAPTAAPTDVPPTATSAPAMASSSGLKDGTYTGPSVDVRWGLVQVQATVKGGKIADVQFVQYPSDRRTSQRINQQADPWLQQEAIQSQSANVDLISGATLTSEGFVESLQGALQQAQS